MMAGYIYTYIEREEEIDRYRYRRDIGVMVRI